MSGVINVRPDWLECAVREFQRVVTFSADDARAYLAQAVPTPRSPLEGLILAGLTAQMKLSLNDVTLFQDVPPATVERAKYLIDHSYATITTVSALARAVHCHPTHLERMFKTSYGTSVHQYVRMKRVEVGLRLIQEGFKVEAAAFTVGFRSRSAFYASVRAIAGASPASARRA